MPGSLSRYRRAIGRIPRGETRTFGELAALAGRPGAARVVGRVVRAAGAELAWHRVVASDGAFLDERADEQLDLLRREGARPRASEPVARWARRVGAALVGTYATRRFLSVGDPGLEAFASRAVEPLANESLARARGFAPVGEEPEAAIPDPRALRVPRVRGAPRRTLAERLAALDWHAAEGALLERGWARFPALLHPAECARIVSDATRAGRFERSVVMARHGFGVGAYHYYTEPLVEPARELRERLYPLLLPAARALAPRADFPPTLAGFQRRCRAAGQRRSSAILLTYGPGGINHPHRDLYGDVAFPLQALVVLSRRGRDFEGGEFVLLEEVGEEDVEHALPVDLGDVVVFGSSHRRARGARRKVPLRHGMRPVTRGERLGLGIVFHLAR